MISNTIAQHKEIQINVVAFLEITKHEEGRKKERWQSGYVIGNGKIDALGTRHQRNQPYKGPTM